MNSCFPPLAALNIGAEDKTGADGGDKTRRKSARRNSCASISNSIDVSAPKSKQDGKLSASAVAKTDASVKSNVGKIEVLQDLDLYYIKQIAHNLKEYDLEQKIELEIKMREGTTKLLAACKHQTQALEAAKSLLISNERMNAYMSELQKRKRDSAIARTRRCVEGRLSLSDLRIPLIWRDTDHFKNKGDYRRFAIFCLVKVGTEMYDTSLLCPIDRSSTDLTFPDSLIFNKITPDFEAKLEVYSHMLQDDLSIASAPRRIKNTIHTSISRTVGKKLAATLQDELNAGKIGPNFELMASASLSLDDTNDNIRTHDLKIESTVNGRHQLPLFGHFCCRLAAQPNCIQHEAYSGCLYAPECFIDNYSKSVTGTITGYKDRRNWLKCCAQLVAFKLKLWAMRKRSSAVAADKEPDACVPINKNTILNCGKNSPVDIEISQTYNASKIVLRCESSDERTLWYKHLAQHISDCQRWKEAAETEMKIQMNEPCRNSYATTKHVSLYDQTTIIDNGLEERPFKDRKNIEGGPTIGTANDVKATSKNINVCASVGACGTSPPFRERLSSSSSSFSKSRIGRLSAWSFPRSHR